MEFFFTCDRKNAALLASVWDMPFPVLMKDNQWRTLDNIRRKLTDDTLLDGQQLPPLCSWGYLDRQTYLYFVYGLLILTLSWMGGGWLCPRLIFKASLLRDDAFNCSHFALNLVTWVPSTIQTPKKFKKFKCYWVIQLVTKWSKKPIQDRVND